jgi:hypothetical protein
MAAAGDPAGPDDLYALEPAAFVAARDALARRLRRDGARDDAALVAKLRRPTPTAWALNQVARQDPPAVVAAIDAGARLRAASSAAVGGARDGLRGAAAEDRAATAAVVDAAAGHLPAATPDVRAKLAATVRVATLDAGVADQLRRGVLSADHETPGVGFTGTEPDPPLAAPSRAQRPPKRKTPARAAHDDAPSTAGDHRGDEEDIRARAVAEAKAAAAEAAHREEQHAAAARRAEQLAELETLETRAATLDAEATAAEQAATRARRDADAAGLEAGAARRALDDPP